MVGGHLVKIQGIAGRFHGKVSGLDLSVLLAHLLIFLFHLFLLWFIQFVINELCFATMAAKSYVQSWEITNPQKNVPEKNIVLKWVGILFIPKYYQKSFKSSGKKANLKLTFWNHNLHHYKENVNTSRTEPSRFRFSTHWLRRLALTFVPRRESLSDNF